MSLRPYLECESRFFVNLDTTKGGGFFFLVIIYSLLPSSMKIDFAGFFSLGFGEKKNRPGKKKSLVIFIEQ